MADQQDQSDSRDQRVDALIAAYLEAVDAGRAPDRQELRARHPHRALAGELNESFADHDRVERMAEPLRPASPPPSGGTEPEGEATGVFRPPEEATRPPADGRTGGSSPAQTTTLAFGETPAAGPPLGTKVRYIGDYELLE